MNSENRETPNKEGQTRDDAQSPDSGSSQSPNSSKSKRKRPAWFRIPIYARIFGGMIAGLLVGLLFGPQSALLKKDRLKVTTQSSIVSQPGKEVCRIDKDKTDAKRANVKDSEKGSDVITVVQPGAELKIISRKTIQGDTWFEALLVKRTERRLSAEKTKDSAAERIRGWIPAECVSLPYSSKGESVVSFLRPIGKIFLRLIKMLVVPLVFVSLLVGVFSLSDIKKLGRMGGKTLLYYTATTALAILIGLTLANIIKPGRYVTEKQRDSLVASYESEAVEKKDKATVEDTGVVNRIVHMIPVNPIDAAARGDMLQIIFFALFFGIILRRVPGKEPEKLIGIFETINQALIKAVMVVMETAPFGVLALLADVTGSSGLSVLLSLGVYTLVVLAGLGIHTVLTYGLAIKLLTSISPWKFLKAARPAQLMGFSTSSSAATLPITFKCAGENLGISKPVSSFVLPLGATVNMDGTALYQAVAAVFVSQVFGLPLSLEAQLTVLLTALLASVGAAAVPGAGIIMLAMVLESAGLPYAGVALVLGVDRLLDMFRTAVNVTGDLSAATVVASSEHEFGK